MNGRIPLEKEGASNLLKAEQRCINDMIIILLLVSLFFYFLLIAQYFSPLLGRIMKNYLSPSPAAQLYYNLCFVITSFIIILLLLIIICDQSSDLNVHSYRFSYFFVDCWSLLSFFIFTGCASLECRVHRTPTVTFLARIGYLLLESECRFCLKSIL
jgi:hypothetical protein